MKSLCIGSRGSALALVQTQQIQTELERIFSGIQITVQVIKTTGDRNLESSFAAIGSKGVFVKELDEALLSKKIDFAVHSLKDLPSDMARGVIVAAVTRCLDPRDALVSRNRSSFSKLPSGAIVGTSSVRRQALIRKYRPDLKVEMLRGNLDTRLRKLDEGKYDAIVIASAGLKRLGFDHRATERLDPFQFIPAIGQGMLAITCREGDKGTLEALQKIDDPMSHRLADIQRRFMNRIGGGCQIPLGCYGEERKGKLRLVAFLGSVDGTKEVRLEMEGSMAEGDQLADRLAEEILDQGGREIMNTLRPPS